MTSPKLKPYPRKRPLQARAAATVEVLLGAAADVFERKGFAASSVNEIAERAGVSIGSLYQYYPSKEALLVALIERHTRSSLALLEEALTRTAALSLEAAVREVVSVMIQAHRAPLHRLLAHGQDEIGRLEELEREVDQRAGGAVAAFLERRRAEICVTDVELSAFILVRAVDSLAHAVLAERPEAIESGALLDELCALVLGYLTRRADPPGA